jgi:hypothetical protein
LRGPEPDIGTLQQPQPTSVLVVSDAILKPTGKKRKAKKERRRAKLRQGKEKDEKEKLERDGLLLRKEEKQTKEKRREKVSRRSTSVSLPRLLFSFF